MKKIFYLFFLCFFLFVTSYSWVMGDADAQGAVFKKVHRKVTVKSTGGTVRSAKKGNHAYEGETVRVGAKSEALLRLFDDSTLDLMANSRITLSEMKRPSSGIKNLFFNLGLGNVYIQVEKLLSAQSSFEVEAGGVVCGVRGTAFSMKYDPAQKRLDLNVTEGVVVANAKGVTQTFLAGHHGTFMNGHMIGAMVPNNSTLVTQGNGSSAQGGTTVVPGPSTLSSGAPVTETSNGLPLGGVLGDLNDEFTGGILVNGDIDFMAAEQTQNLRLSVPSREVGP